PPPVYRPLEVKRLATGEVVHPKGMYRLYVVAPHDDLYAIARDLEATPDEIIKANHLKHPGQLTVGQRLKIPVSKAYVARIGDTLRVIAKRFSVSVADLSDLNDLSERAHLHPGDQIALPANIHDRGPVTEEAEAPRARYGGGYTPRGGIVANGEPYTPSPYALEAARERAAASASASASGGAPAAASTAPETSSLSDAEVSALAKGRFIWPVQGALANHFGVTGLGERNDGVDIAAPLGAAVRAAAAGDVVYAGNQIPGFGNLVLIEHADGWVTAYAHLQHMSVHMRQFVSQGEEIGTVGDTGGLASPQLHFEVRHKASAGEKAKPIDPLLALPPQPASP
ncbi:MAG: LysM peptidoglycan-binding domain-containing M23 family metallopeptidase, partial [Alphaproteobacteria bacterium]|nr:LysM peptidoglycan-binding domain-containing M23 family metallopeptidase [Alphaproteobacteria bacterium]